MTRVVNLRSGEPFDIRIDRKTPWGNPWVMRIEAHRELVVRLYEQWVLIGKDPEAVWIREHIHELKDKTIACWCAPKLCHGDILARLAALEPD